MALESLPIATDESSFACAPEPTARELSPPANDFDPNALAFCFDALADSPIATVSAASDLAFVPIAIKFAGLLEFAAAGFVTCALAPVPIASVFMPSAVD